MAMNEPVPSASSGRHHPGGAAGSSFALIENDRPQLSGKITHSLGLSGPRGRSEAGTRSSDCGAADRRETARSVFSLLPAASPKAAYFSDLDRSDVQEFLAGPRRPTRQRVDLDPPRR